MKLLIGTSTLHQTSMTLSNNFCGRNYKFRNGKLFIWC